MIVLGENRYGKSRVRLMKVLRQSERHSIFDWSVDVRLAGDFESCFLKGDNQHILPTDTMKNTVYSQARSSSALCMEDFAAELVTYLVESNPYADLAEVTIRETAWQHITHESVIYDSGFRHGSDERATTTVTLAGSSGLRCTSGIENLALLKTAKSAFAGFLRDPLTTLKETRDRLFGTLLSATWTYSGESTDFRLARPRVMNALLSGFATHDSESVQQTLYFMAKAVLDSVPEVVEIHLSMPNKHYNLVDLSPFRQDNPNQIFVPTDEPHGAIEASVRRAD